MRLGSVLAMALGCVLWAPQLPAQTTRALIIAGVSGEPRLAQQFERDGVAIRDAITRRFNGSAVLLTEQSQPRSDKASVLQALRTLGAGSKAGDQLLVVLIGHGSAQGGVARFNIPGPDLTADELAAALTELKGRSLAVIVATSASGAFLKPLEASGRIIITATKSGAQNEEVVFAQHFAKALSDDVADINKDGSIALSEALEYSKREVARFYQQNNRIATEQAILSGSSESFVFRAAHAKASDPALQKLHDQRAALEQQIAALKSRKAQLDAQAYEADLEKLLLQLAATERQIRAAEKQ